MNSRVSERADYRYFVVKLKKPYTREMSMECYCLSFFFQSGVSLNRKQQQQLVCRVEVRLEFFLKKTLCHDGSFLMSEPNQSVHGFLSLTINISN